MNTYIVVHLDNKARMGGYPYVGYWMNYFVYEIPNHTVPRMDIQDMSCIKMPYEIAMCWKFANSVKDHIKVMKGEDSLMLEQLGEDNPNLEEHNEYKYKYFLTQEDYENTTKFIQMIAMEELRRGYNIIWELEKPRVPDIYVELYKMNKFVSQNISDRMLQYEDKLYRYAKEYEEVEKIVMGSSTIAEAFDALTVVTKTVNPEIDV